MGSLVRHDPRWTWCGNFHGNRYVRIVQTSEIPVHPLPDGNECGTQQHQHNRRQDHGDKRADRVVELIAVRTQRLPHGDHVHRHRRDRYPDKGNEYSDDADSGSAGIAQEDRHRTQIQRARQTHYGEQNEQQDRHSGVESVHGSCYRACGGASGALGASLILPTPGVGSFL